MKLGKAWEQRDLFTGKASELTRQLAFSGIAVVWIFKNSGVSNLVPDDLVLPLFFLVLTLAADILQYIAASLEWSIFTRRQERTKNARQAKDVIDDAPVWLNFPHAFFFYAKLGLLIIGFGTLIHALGARL